MHQSTAEKALSINLNRPLYGSLAEIGAGQEVSRWFFKVGGAAGTIAKAMSAYDKTFSDDIYGKEESGRYVVESRLRKMLDHEFHLLETRLVSPDDQKKYFFSFADTVAARSYKYDGDCHGWMGVRFQRDATEKPSQVVLHMRMHDKSNMQQQEALGVLGVNLIYGAYNLSQDISAFVGSLKDGNLENRIEVNTIHFEGPAFAGVDSVDANIELLRAGLTPALLLRDGDAATPLSEALFRKQVICHRHETHDREDISLDILKAARNDYCGQKEEGLCDPFLLHEIYSDDFSNSNTSLLAKIKDLIDSRQNILLTGFDKGFELTEHIGLFTKNHINLVYQAHQLLTFFEDHRFETLEPVGRIFNDCTRVFIYPVPSNLVPEKYHKNPRQSLFGLLDYKASEKNALLFEHLVRAQYLRPILDHKL